MTKALGFSLLLTAALLFSAQRLTEGKRKMAALDCFCVMLTHMRGILENQAPPMTELLEALSRCCEGEAGVFILRLRQGMERLGSASFQELWQEALSASVSESDTEILRELDALGSVLGRYDLETQCASIDNCLSSLRRSRERLQASLPQSGRLTFGIALCAALLLGVLLI